MADPPILPFRRFNRGRQPLQLAGQQIQSPPKMAIAHFPVLLLTHALKPSLHLDPLGQAPLVLLDLKVDLLIYHAAQLMGDHHTLHADLVLD
jgi:hypothetical protein